MRVALLGVSHWHASMHADAIRAAGATIDTVWDAENTIAADFATSEGGRAVATPTAARAEKPDLIVALGNGPAAASLLADLLAQDIPLLVDKPIGLAARDVAPLAAIAARQHRFVAVPLANRAGPMPGAIASLRSAGTLGRITNTQYRLVNGPAQRYRDWGVGWMLDSAFSGGGALRNLGVHGMDAFLAVAGDQPVRVEHAAFRRDTPGVAVEIYALVILRAADGMVGVVEAGYTHADPTGGDYEWRIDAEGASLAEDGETLHIATPTAPKQSLPAGPKGGRYRAFMADTLARLADGRPPLVSLNDFARANALVDSAYAWTP